MSVLSRRARRGAHVDTTMLGNDVLIACGQSTSVVGGDSRVWSADTGYSGGTPGFTDVSIDITGVTNPAPMSIYQNQRWTSGTLTYTLTGLRANTTYLLRLHFAETYYTAVGQRIMNIAVNGETKATGFDIFAVAGTQNKAVILEIAATSNATGRVVLAFTATSANNDPRIGGIELIGNVVRDNTPTALTAQTYATYVTLRWNAPAFPTGSVSGYNVYQNGVKINSSPVVGTSYAPGQDSAALNPSTAYTFKITTVVDSQETAASSSITVTTGATATGIAWPLRVSSSQRCLEDQTGKAFLVVAETSWTMLTKLSVADCKWIIDKRKSQGFNTIMTNIQAFNPGASGPRGGAFSGTNITQWNESYFQGVDEVISYAESQSIHIMLNGIWMANWGGYSGNSAPSASSMTTFGTKVGNRYKNFPNVSYFVGGDEQADGEGIRPAIWPAVQAYASALHAAAPNQIITYHPRWYSYTTTTNQSWLSYNSYQANDNSRSLNQMTQDGRNLSPARPIFCIEPPYDPDTAMGGVATSPLINRQNQWGSLLGGALGVSYGGPHNAWYAGYGGNDQPATYGPLDTNVYNRVCPVETGHVGRILASYQWQSLVPNNGLVNNGGSSRGQNYAALSSDGRLFVTYTQGNVTINTSSMQGTLTGQWYNPSTGQAAGSSFSVNRGSGQSFVCPTGSDGVLIVSS